MRLGEGVEWAMHSVTVLALLPEGAALSASRLAEFHHAPAAYLAKVMQSLARAGVVDAAPGRRGGYRLARPVNEITLLEVVEAVEGDEPSFKCTEIRRHGPARVADDLYTPVCPVVEFMDRADAAWRRELRSATVADLLGRLTETVTPAAMLKEAGWLKESIS